MITRQNKKKQRKPTTAYFGTMMTEQPCVNPNCKSHGKPHPNCKCHGNRWGKETLAKGGEVPSFCSEDNVHDEDCEYFADGGEVEEVEDPEEVGTPRAYPELSKREEHARVKGQMKRVNPQHKASGGPVGKFSDLTDEGPPTGQKFSEMQDEGPPQQQDDTDILGVAKDIGKTAFASSLVGHLVGYKPDIHPQSKAAMENFAEGFVPGAKKAESLAGLDTKENIAERDTQYPGTAGVAKAAGVATSMLLGPLKYAGAAVTKIPAVAAMGAVGAQRISEAVQQVAQTTIDDIDNYLMGQGPQNAGDAVAAWALDAGFAAGTSFALGSIAPYTKKLPAIADKKITENATRFLIRMGENPISATAISSSVAGGMAAKAVYDAKEGNYLEAAGEGLGAGVTALVLQHVLHKPATIGNRKIGQAAAWALGKNKPEAVNIVSRFASGVSNGLRKLEPLVEASVRGGASQFVPYATEKQIKFFKESIENGGPYSEMEKEISNPMGDVKFSDMKDEGPPEPHMAGGGEVSEKQEKEHFGNVYPEANVLMGAAKGRIYNYVNSLRPSVVTKLPFDSDPPGKAKARSYENAVQLAVNPLSIMNKVTKGDLTIEDMKHFTSMHPEIYSLISKKMTKRITEAQLKKEKPPYKNRKAMSLFLGASLDSTVSPENIRAVQMMYAAKGSQQQQMPKSSAKMKTPNSYLTNQQANVNREQNSKN